jgi:hypothetical protein
MGQEDINILEHNDLSLLETVDHVLNRGLVISGDITISVADIDLICVDLNVVLGSIEAINKALGSRMDVRIADGQVDNHSGDS